MEQNIGGATYKVEKGGCVIYFKNVKISGWGHGLAPHWPTWCLRPCSLISIGVGRQVQGHSKIEPKIHLRM